MEHCGICQQPISDDLHLSITQTTLGSSAGDSDDTVEEMFRLLLCHVCWSIIDDEHSASGKYFRGLIKRPA
jgi:hypothetical protein